MRTAKTIVFINIFITFSLLILGGIVHNTESSLACPDWPTCYGQFFPEMKGGILIEHSHRLLATLVGFLSILVVAFSFKERRNSAEHEDAFRMGVIALVMVIAQGVLGGITVIYKLPTIVSTTHLGLSMIFFCTITLLHHRLSVLLGKEIKLDESFASRYKPLARHGFLLSGIFVYVQIVLGAFMRHSGSGASCGLGMKAALLCQETGSWDLVWWPSSGPAQLHAIHRYFAYIVSALVIFFSVRMFLEFRKSQEHKSKAVWFLTPVLLIVTQVLLGMMTVIYHISVTPTTAHLAVGALCLIVIWKLNLMAVSVEKVHFKNGTNSLLSDLVELTKPNLSLLVVVTSLVGLILAPTHINFFQGLLALILIGLVVIGATSLNCYLEKDIDALMERTKMRALPTGRMSTSTAVAFGVICSFVGVVGLFVWINTATALLAALASLLYLFAYTPMKLKSDMALYVGAIPGAIPPVMGWTAATGSFGPMAWVLFLVLFVWQLPHFMAISIYHADDYQRANIKVLPNLRGKAFAKWGILLLTMLLFVISLAPVKWGNVAPAYVWSSCLLGGLLTLTASLGLFIKNNSERESSWAKNYFLATVIYLPLQLGAMLFLH